MQQPTQMKINLRDHGTQITCEECGGQVFKDGVFIFKVSKLITGESQDSVVPVPTFVCEGCGHINKEFQIPGKEEKPLVTAQ
jgi:hypothetical protein